MQSKFTAGLIVLALVLAGVGCGSARAGVDISKYMPWQAGQWSVVQEYDPLDSSCSDCFLKKEEKSGFVVSKSGSYTIHSYYHDDGNPGVWKESNRMKYTRSSDSVNLIAIRIDNKWWSLNPALSIPRSLNVNQPFVYNGVRINGSSQQPFSLVMTVAKQGVSVTTPAGSFEDCIQTQWVIALSKEAAEVETKLMAKGVGDVKIWHASLNKAAKGFAAEAFDADTEYHEVVEMGPSGSPFP
jgi:hypothetical protein